MLPPLLALFGPGCLAVRPATRRRRHRRDWTVASNRRTRRTTAGADRRNLCSRPCRTGDGATGHHHRAVADRAVSRESRLGGRIREARNAFSRRVGGPDRGHRRHQQGGAVQEAIEATPGVVSVMPTGQSVTGRTRWSVVIDAVPGSAQAFEIVAELRVSVHTADPFGLVGDRTPRRSTFATPPHEIGWWWFRRSLLWCSWFSTCCCGPPSRRLVLTAATVLSAFAALGLGSSARSTCRFPRTR